MSASRPTSTSDVTVPATLGPVRTWASSALLVAAWAAALSTSIYAVYSVHGVVILCLAVLIAAGAVWSGTFRTMPPALLVAAMAVGVVVGLIVTPPLINVDTTAWITPAIVLGAIASLSVLLVFVPKVSAGRLALIPLGIAALAFAGMILGGVPRIDVWVIFQETAKGLLHGQNPYAMTFTGVPAGQTSDCFNYLPVTFLLTAPSEWLFGDVRWVLAACLLGTGGLLVWHVARRGAGRAQVGLATLAALTPGALMVVQQTWNEPVLLLGLVATAVLMDRGRWNWAMVPLALALATKQHLVLLLPLLLFWPRFGWRRVLGSVGIAVAVSLPWFVVNPARFTQCTADFFLGEQAPPKALSIWRLLPAPVQMPVLLIALVVAFVLVLWRCPRTASGFLVASGMVFMVFDLFNKQTFVNQWWLAAALLVSGLALHRFDAQTSDDDQLMPVEAGVP